MNRVLFCLILALAPGCELYAQISSLISIDTHHSAGGGSAFAFVQAPAAWGSVNSTVCTVTFPSNVTAGNLVVLSVNNQSQPNTLTPTDGSGDTFVADIPNTVLAGAWTTQSWHVIPTTTRAETITFTAGTSGAMGCMAAEFSGQAASSPTDAVQFQALSFTTNPTITTTGNLTQNNDLVVGFFFTNQFAGTLTTPGTGFTACSTANSTTNLCEYKILSGGSGSTTTATTAAESSGANTVEQIIPYKP